MGLSLLKKILASAFSKTVNSHQKIENCKLKIINRK